MCFLTDEYWVDEFIGYKVAAQHKKTKRYHSVAMGFQYRKGAVPNVKHQNRIGKFFCDDILIGITRNEDMIGRTAAFSSPLDAIDLLYEMKSAPQDYNYELVVIKIKLSGELMEGYYHGASPVVAGRNIVSYRKLKLDEYECRN
jgi:hypothetical protein